MKLSGEGELGDGEEEELFADEVGLAIFAHLAPIDLLRCAAPVCRRFHRWAHDPALWRSLLARQLFVAPAWRTNVLCSSPSSPPLRLLPPLPFSYLDFRSPSPSAPALGPHRHHTPAPPATYEEWWCRLAALDRRVHELQRLLALAAPNPTFFCLGARLYALPPALAPLACLASTTCSTASSSSSTSEPQRSSSLFPLAARSSSSSAPSSAASPPDAHSLEDVLTALDFGAPELQRFKDAHTMVVWFELQLSVRINGDRDGVKSAIRACLGTLMPHHEAPRPPPVTSALVEPWTLYHVQKKHDPSASGMLILHHDINALVFIRIGDFD